MEISSQLRCLLYYKTSCDCDGGTCDVYLFLYHSAVAVLVNVRPRDVFHPLFGQALLKREESLPKGDGGEVMVDDNRLWLSYVL